MSDSDESILEARAFLRAHLSGTIGFDGEFVPIKVVVAPDGALVAPVMVAMLRTFDNALFMPDEGEDAMHMQVTLEEIQDRGDTAALCDRWRIYHGEPEDVRWARISIDAAKHLQWFVDGEALLEANPLAKDEAGLLKALNTQPRSFLKALCTTGKAPSEHPVAVGIDPGGIDVRRAHDVVRLPFPLRLDTAAKVRSFMESTSPPFMPGMA